MMASDDQPGIVPLTTPTPVPDAVPADGPATSDELLPAVYDELRKLAKARLARERQPHQTLQPTALVLQLIEEPSRPDEFARQNREAGGDRQPPWTGQGDHRDSCDQQHKAAHNLRDSDDAFHCLCRRCRPLHRSSAGDKRRHP